MHAKSRTLFQKIWDTHLVRPEAPETPAVLYVDLHLVHEATSPQAFNVLRERGLRVRRPERTVATVDHVTPTLRNGQPTKEASEMLSQIEANCRDFGITLHTLGSEHQGIVHVIGPELGLTQPGKTIVCGDSHTSTHGAFGALAFGVGTSEVGHVLTTQSLLQRRPRTLAICATGRLQPGVTAKDLILSVIAKLGFGGATGHTIEYLGPAVRALSMDERMTVCNMAIEAGARSGLVAPDDTTFQWLYGRPFAPTGAEWDRAVAGWRKLPTDEGAAFDRTVDVDVSALEPMITWGTNPATGIPLRAPVPEPTDPTAEQEIRYMGLQPGRPLLGHPIDVVFIGSCTNSRLSDLRLAAKVFRGRKVAAGLRVLVVPGSQQVKRAAEAEGLDRIFRDAGAEWRDPGCSMCLAMNGDRLEPGQYCVSTSNRNFEGRQGPGGRTFLASPLTAAAAAVTGKISDVRELVSERDL